MSSRNIPRLVMSILRPLVIIATPEVLFYATIAVSALFFGGHHHAFLFHNPYCSGVQSAGEASESTTFLPPRLLLQISDIHVSHHSIDSGRSKLHMRIFEKRILPTWGPLAHAVVVSGDLVNAIEKNDRPLGTRSEQLVSEWSYLADFATRVNDVVPWYASHGNHDTFGGPPLHHQHIHPYLSPLTNPHNRSSPSSNRVLHHSIANNSISLIALDLSQNNPIHRPFNFFGDASSISPASFSRLPAETPSLVFAHYPSSVSFKGTSIHQSISLSSDGDQAENGISKPKVSAFLSGHLHSLYGVAPKGLSAVSSVSGALELQTLDLVASGAFRVLAFDHSGTLVTTTTLSVNLTDNPLNDLVFLNPPAAGLCPPAAGSAALASKHIQILSPFSNLVDIEVHASIDGLDHGPVISLNQSCVQALALQSSSPEDDYMKRSLLTCQHLYGFEWNPESFKTGTHLLTLTMPSSEKKDQSRVYAFSLDGSAPSEFKHVLARLVSALFALSEFDTMAYILSYSAILLCCSLCTYTLLVLRKQQMPSMVMLIYAVAILLGAPVLIAPSLTVHPEHESFGWLGLYSLSLPSEPNSFTASVDASFIASHKILWATLVQASFVPILAHVESITRGCHPALLRYTVLYPAYLALRRSYSWTMEIAGAHGYTAALLSPGCAPLFILVVWYSLSVILTSHIFFPRDVDMSSDKKDE